jgi:hypothetical protein
MPANRGFELQPGDIELIHYVYQLRSATIDHLSVLSGRSVRALWNRLLKLKERRYLVSVARFMQKHVYGIGSAGLSVIVEEGYAPEEVANTRLRQRELKELGIRHALFIADIHTRMLLLTRSSPVRITAWREGQALWDSVAPQAGVPAVPIRPDAYSVLTYANRPPGKNTFHIFWEADRSTMAHSRMVAKITGYLAYYDQGVYRRKYPGMKSFLVAVVTETRARAEELGKELVPLIPAAAHDAYLFIAYEDLGLAALLPRATATDLKHKEE